MYLLLRLLSRYQISSLSFLLLFPYCFVVHMIQNAIVFSSPTADVLQYTLSSPPFASISTLVVLPAYLCSFLLHAMALGHSHNFTPCLLVRSDFHSLKSTCPLLQFSLCLHRFFVINLNSFFRCMRGYQHNDIPY